MTFKSWTARLAPAIDISKGHPCPLFSVSCLSISRSGIVVSSNQSIQYGSRPATIAEVAQTAWRALSMCPAARSASSSDQPPPPPWSLPDIFLRYLARAYDRLAQPLPDGIDDLEAIGEEIEDTGWKAVASMGGVLHVDHRGRFWRMARCYHEAIAWLQAPETDDCFWLDASEHPPQDGQAVIYYFDVVGPHVGWYFHNDHGGGWSGHSGFLGHEVTHWMPLPGPWPVAPVER